VFLEVTNGEDNGKMAMHGRECSGKDLWMKIVVKVEDVFQYQGGTSFTKLSPVNPKPGVVTILIQNLPPT